MIEYNILNPKYCLLNVGHVSLKLRHLACYSVVGV